MLANSHRFHGYNSLNFVHQKGQVVRSTGMSLKYVRNGRRETYRVAVVVAKKVHKSAVVRNRIRRRVYEAVRTHEASIKEPYDLVFMVYDDNLATLPALELQKLVTGQLTKAGVVV